MTRVIVKRVATFLFQSLPPAAVDEELALYEDGMARLAVRRPRTGGPTIGTYSYRPDKADFAELAKAGPGPLTLDLLGPVPEEQRDLLTLASRIADEARDHPEATASFYGQPVGQPAGGETAIALQAVGGGTRTVEFDLAPGSCAIIFDNDGAPAGWFEFPKLELGFVTTDAEDLGGLRRRAEIKPGDWGTVLVKVPTPSAVTGVSVQVAGTLYEALPDDVMPGRYEVRTETKRIEPSA